MVTGDDAQGRARLERRAFGPSSSDADRDDAIEALRRLDAGPAVVHGLGAQPVGVQAIAAQPSALLRTDLSGVEEPLADPAPRSRRRRAITPAVIALSVIVAAVVGVGISRATSVTTNARMGTAITSPAPVDTANPAAAFTLLLRTQTPADRAYPMLQYAATSGIQPASIHLAMEISTGDRLWVARSEADICMMWTSPRAHDGSMTGESTCVAPAAFAHGGITLTHDGNAYTWDGVNFTITG